MPHQGHPFFAAFYDLFIPFQEHYVGEWRRELVAHCRGRVLDLGAGLGPNFPLLREQMTAGAVQEVHAVEPDPFMVRRARKQAAALNLPVTFWEQGAEALPLENESVDCVLATLVLCTVQDLSAALREIRRVLRPGGELRFMEHVRAEGGTGVAQDLVTPLWKVGAAGCHLNRRTGELIRSQLPAAQWRELSLPFPIGRIIVGSARKEPA